MGAVPRNDVVAFVAGSLAGESTPLCVEDAVAAALRLLDEFDDHGWTVGRDADRFHGDDEIRVEFAGVDLTPAWISVAGVTYDVVPRGEIPKCPDASEVIATTVAATLDYVSGWNVDEDNVDDYRARAEQVRTYVDVGWRESACCPVCAEVVCDDDCPLYVVRDLAGVWVGSTGASSDVEEPEADDYVPGEEFDVEREQQAAAPDDEEVETINDCLVGRHMSGGISIGALGVPHSFDDDKALRLAAWIVALVDPIEERFPKVLRAVMST